MQKLIVMSGPVDEKEYDLGDEVTIGRSSKANIKVKDPVVSRLHAKIYRTEDGYEIEDLKSGNGTFLNEKKVTRARLTDGCHIRISGTLFVFQDQSGDTTEPTIQAAIDASEDPLVSDKLEVKTKDDLAILHRRLGCLREISEAVGTLLDLDELLKEIVHKLSDVYPQADRCVIMLMDDQTGQLKVKVARDRLSSSKVEVPTSQTIISRAIGRREALLSLDAQADDRFYDGHSVFDLNIRSMMCVPLICKNKVVGVIHVDAQQANREFGEDDLNLLTSIGTQVALAIENARMHQRLMTRQRIDKELQLAQTLQKRFLPQTLPEIEGYSLQAHYSPAQEVGGDFYDFIPLRDDRLGVVIGDVSGKGFAAALLMARLTSDVRFHAQSIGEPKDVLAQVNNLLSEGVTGGIFVTMIYLCLHIPTRKVVVANAGHPHPIVASGKTRQIRRIEENVNHPLGIIPDASFEQYEFLLDRQETLIAFTDGVIEARDAQKRMYGYERLEKLLEERIVGNRGAPGEGDGAFCADRSDSILDDIEGFVGSTPQSDDLTLVSVCVK